MASLAVGENLGAALQFVTPKLKEKHVPRAYVVFRCDIEHQLD